MLVWRFQPINPDGLRSDFRGGDPSETCVSRIGIRIFKKESLHGPSSFKGFWPWLTWALRVSGPSPRKLEPTGLQLPALRQAPPATCRMVPLAVSTRQRRQHSQQLCELLSTLRRNAHDMDPIRRPWWRTYCCCFWKPCVHPQPSPTIRDVDCSTQQKSPGASASAP